MDSPFYLLGFGLGLILGVTAASPSKSEKERMIFLPEKYKLVEEFKDACESNKFKVINREADGTLNIKLPKGCKCVIKKP